MTKLLLATLHRFVSVCAALNNAMEKSESPLSGQELTEWTGLVYEHTDGISFRNATSVNNINRQISSYVCEREKVDARSDGGR